MDHAMTESISTMYSMALWNERRQSNGDDKSAFWNYGYWFPTTSAVETASEQLLEHLLAKLPSGAVRVLDVAFGKGESTRRLCKIFGEPNVIGINIAADQLEAARKRGVGCELRIMDAAQMQFEEESFDAVVCIEAAFHFHTRTKFLERARALLRPGGRLIMSDLLLRSGHGLSPDVFPTENQVQSLDEYSAAFKRAGFGHHQVQIDDTTQLQIVPYFARRAESMGVLDYRSAGKAAANLSRADMWNLWFMTSRLLNVSGSVIVTADK
jgi:MPBQ/MSBQ methyltransferase